MAALFIEKEGKMGWINQAFSFCCLRPVDSPLDIEGSSIYTALIHLC